MDLFIVLIFIVGVLVLAAVINSISTQNRIKRFIVKLKKNFGKLERKEYDPEKYTSYRGYFIRLSMMKASLLMTLHGMMPRERLFILR